MKKRIPSILLALVLLLCGVLLSACEKTPEATLVDKTKLSARILYAEKNFFANDDQTYTDESFAALQEALSRAKALRDNSDATQEQVNEALDVLNAAIEGLVHTFQRAYNIDELSEFIAGIGFNYTLNVTDYSGAEPEEYQAYYTDTARYYEKTKSGIAAYDGYVHSWSYGADGGVQMGGVYFKADASPMVYLYADEMHRIIRSLGNIEEYEIWGSASFANLKNTNVYVSTEENYIETFTELATGMQLDAAMAEKIGGIAVEIVQNGETNVLTVTVYGEHYLDPIIQYTVTDVGSTSLEVFDSYIAANPKYTSSSDPIGLLEHYYDLYEWEDAVRFQVFTASQGLSGEVPDYVITSVNLENSYWHSTKSNRALICLSGVKLTEASTETGNVVLGKEAAFNRFAISFYTYCIEKREAYLNAEGTDEWFIDLAQYPTVKDFAVRFFDVEDSDAALITKLSVGVNADGNLVITLWRAHSGLKEWDGVILRAVLTESTYQGDTVAVEPVERYFASLESLEELEDALDRAKEISAERYTAESYAVLQSAILKAEEVVANPGRTAEDIGNANTQIALAIQKLVLLPSQQDVAELNNLLIRAHFYTPALYTSESYAVLANAISSAENLLEQGEYLPEDLKQQITRIEQAIQGLVRMADKSRLCSVLQQLQSMDLGGYTARSAEPFRDALLAGQSVAENDNSTQDEIEDVLQALLNAQDALEAIAVSKADLQAALDKAHQTANQGSYTAESVAALEAVCARAEEALSDSDLSEALCNSLLKMLQNRSAELESVDFETDGNDAKAVQTWVNNTFKVGQYSGISISGYEFTVTYADGSVKTYISKVGKYFYNVTDNEGYVKLEKLIHRFTLENGEVVLGDACFNLAGTYLATYFTHLGISDPGYLSGSMTRIGNSNEWFANQTRWLAFLPELPAEAYGFGVLIQENGLTVRVYGGDALVESIASANRTDLLATVTFANIGNATLADVDALLGSESLRVSAEDAAEALHGLKDNYTVVNLSSGMRIIRTERYYLQGESGWILIDGTVHQLFFIEGEYRVGGSVYVDGMVATSLDQVLVSVAELQTIPANHLKLFYDDWNEEDVHASYYRIVDENGTVDNSKALLLAQLAGVELTDGDPLPDLSISVTGYGCICVVEGDVSGVRPDNFYTFTEVGTTANADLDALLGE